MDNVRFLLPTLFTALISTPISASNMGDFYLGTELSIYNESTITHAHGSNDNPSNLGYSAHLGYLFDTHDFVKLGIEVEYRQLGKNNYLNEMIIESNAAFLNFKPTFVNDDTHLYSALLLGVGNITSNVKTIDDQDHKNTIGYQYGIEVGYNFRSGFSAYLGYKGIMTNIDDLILNNLIPYDIELNSSGPYVGINYSF